MLRKQFDITASVSLLLTLVYAILDLVAKAGWRKDKTLFLTVFAIDMTTFSLHGMIMLT